MIGMFDTAVNYVYELMEAKTLPRFLKSEQCKKLRIGIERHTLIHNRLVSGGYSMNKSRFEKNMTCI